MCCVIGKTFARLVIDPRHWGNSGLIQSVVTKRDNIEILCVVENCL